MKFIIRFDLGVKKLRNNVFWSILQPEFDVYVKIDFFFACILLLDYFYLFNSIVKVSC